MSNRLNSPKPALSLWQYILSDLARYKATDNRSYISMLILCPGAMAGIMYRIGHWMWTYKGPLLPLVWLWRPAYIVVKRLSEILTGISIQPQAVIGEGLYIVHGDSVHIGGKVVMGSNCNISHEVTLGVGGRGDKRGTPVLGNRVFIAPGVKIFGQVEIGDDVAIGANAVVTRSIPARAVAVGIPAEVISYEGSFDYVLYEGMEADFERGHSLQLKSSEDTEQTTTGLQRLRVDE